MMFGDIALKWKMDEARAADIRRWKALEMELQLTVIRAGIRSWAPRFAVDVANKRAWAAADRRFR